MFDISSVSSCGTPDKSSLIGCKRTQPFKHSFTSFCSWFALFPGCGGMLGLLCPADAPAMKLLPWLARTAPDVVVAACVSLSHPVVAPLIPDAARPKFTSSSPALLSKTSFRSCGNSTPNLISDKSRSFCALRSSTFIWARTADAIGCSSHCSSSSTSSTCSFVPNIIAAFCASSAVTDTPFSTFSCFRYKIVHSRVRWWIRSSGESCSAGLLLAALAAAAAAARDFALLLFVPPRSPAVPAPDALPPTRPGTMPGPPTAATDGGPPTLGTTPALPIAGSANLSSQKSSSSSRTLIACRFFPTLS
mmetsp:Transcript_25176/g.63345  ORF Transcript_25176/g.63345 Transcript_25176/m.63345 type:complete len:305 (+) Transcript_25176:2496-3410(+)